MRLVNYEHGALGASITASAAFGTLAALSEGKIRGLSNADLNIALKTATAAQNVGVPGAQQTLDMLRKEKARRSAASGGNTKLYLLGGAAALAGWFFFIRK